MPDNPTDAEQKLQKLGQRIRDGFAKENPTPDRSLETIRDTVRQQWESERASKTRPPPEPGPQKKRRREPEPPEPGG